MEDLNTTFDVLVVGTGFVECLVAAAAARIGKKVLQVDQNDYYGGAWASFSFQGLQQWVSDVSTLHSNQQETNNTDSEKLVDGRMFIKTSHPNGIFFGLKQTWLIPLENDYDEPQDELEGAMAADNYQSTAGDNSQPSTGDNSQPSTGDNSQHSTGDNSQPAVGDSLQPRADDSIKPTSNGIFKMDKISIKTWCQRQLMEMSRKFNIDLTCKLLFSKGPLVELLISSNVARYVEFKSISRILTQLPCSPALVPVPFSRSDIFTSTSLSLIEKRMLMKFLEHCLMHDVSDDTWKAHEEDTFSDFLLSQKLTENLRHFVTESIAMIDPSDPFTLGVTRTQLFLASLGRYGSSPFLFPMYGCGEMPQAFCRLCAVFEGTHILRSPVSKVVLRSDGMCIGVLCGDQEFSCANLVIHAAYQPQCWLGEGCRDSISRGIFVIDRSILTDDREHLTFMHLTSHVADELQPINVVELGSGSGICPPDLFVVHMTCQGNDAQTDLQCIYDRLFYNGTDGTDDRPRCLWSLYFNVRDLRERKSCGRVPANVHICIGPDAELNYGSAIEQARRIFANLFPNEDFLPRAPDAEEIKFDVDEVEEDHSEVVDGGAPEHAVESAD